MGAVTTSKAWFERARKIIPGGVNSPVRSLKWVGGDPVYFVRGEGAYLYDVEGKRYVDFCLSFGPHLLGHSPTPVVEAVSTQVRLATSFGACHPLEVQLAEKLLRAYPFLDCARLVNSGTEACMTAIRVARGFTGRRKVVKFEGCYHGHSDGLLARAGSGVAALSEASSKGVPPSVVADTLIARFDDLSTVERHFAEHPNDIAAVLLEPIPANDGLWVPPKAHLESLLALARRHGALVLFDEVINGFRVGPHGAAGYYGLEPDLVTLGKIIGGGLPMAAVLGRRAAMETLAPVGEVYQAGTLSGNPLAAAAGIGMLEELERHPPFRELEERTQWFAHALAEKLTRSQGGPIHVRHVGSMFWLHFGEEPKVFPPLLAPAERDRFAAFFRKALAAGVYYPPSPYEVAFLSTAHTRAVLEDVLLRF
jgi:glutamate-1-semialdehyde 2,1-aminomutase